MATGSVALISAPAPPRQARSSQGIRCHPLCRACSREWAERMRCSRPSLRHTAPAQEVQPTIQHALHKRCWTQVAPLDHADEHQEVCGEAEQYGGNESPCSGTRHESVCTLPILESLSAWRLDDNLSPYTPCAVGDAAQCCSVQSISGAIWVDCHEKGHPPSTAYSDMVPKFLKKSRFLRVKPASRQRHLRGQRATLPVPL